MKCWQLAQVQKYFHSLVMSVLFGHLAVHIGDEVSFCISLSPDKPINLEKYCVPRQWRDERREAVLPGKIPLTFIPSKLSWNPPLNGSFVNDRKLSKFFWFSFSIGHLCFLGAFLKLSQVVKICFYFDTVFSCSCILFSEMRGFVGKEFQAQAFWLFPAVCKVWFGKILCVMLFLKWTVGQCGQWCQVYWISW